MTGPLVFWVFILLTLLFIVIGGICAIYLLIGISQLIVGHKESNLVKIRSGYLVALVSFLVLAVAFYFYFELINA